jgi:hypothetical protein
MREAAVGLVEFLAEVLKAGAIIKNTNNNNSPRPRNAKKG